MRLGARKARHLDVSEYSDLAERWEASASEGAAALTPSTVLAGALLETALPTCSERGAAVYCFSERSLCFQSD
jgi:hypothetical protein